MLSVLLILCTVPADGYTNDEPDVSRSDLEFVDLTRGNCGQSDEPSPPRQVSEKSSFNLVDEGRTVDPILATVFPEVKQRSVEFILEPKLALKGLSLAAFSTYLRDALAG